MSLAMPFVTNQPDEHLHGEALHWYAKVLSSSLFLIQFFTRDSNYSRWTSILEFSSI
jgi:hypothetical protein